MDFGFWICVQNPKSKIQNGFMEERESIGRIEVAPDVLTTIARAATLGVNGVSRMAGVPAHLFRRGVRQDGIALVVNDGQIALDIYLVMDPQVNVLQASRAVQTAVIEALDKMVGVPVEAVNIHVEDVVYSQGESS
ncbi:MAG: Asp23/Gls24 family envelope stress response protein [Chloroflexota bacterium]